MRKRKPRNREARWPPLVVVGLTGGIASGKSTVAGMFGALGARVLDADQVGRDVVVPGRPALAELVAAFGSAVLLPDGQLDRRAVADRVFGSAAELSRLNRITHPRIGWELNKKLLVLATEKPDPPVVVLEAAVLVEAGWYHLVDRIVVVVAQHSTQVARLMAVNGLDAAQAEARVRAQLPLRARLRFADHWVDGESSLSETQQQVALIWEDLVRRSRTPYGPPDHLQT
jgi:dephospho-CoA kinase